MPTKQQQQPVDPRLKLAAAFLQPTAQKATIVPRPVGYGSAEVDTDNPTTIRLGHPLDFTPPVASHELTHVFQNTRNKAIIPAPNPSGNPYEYGGQQGLIQARQHGKTIADYGPEQQAKMVENFQKETLAAMQANDPKRLDAANQAYEPFVKQLSNLPGQDDPMNSIDTSQHYVPPAPPAALTGIMAPSPLLGGDAKLVPQFKGGK